MRIWDVQSRQCLQTLPDSHQDQAWGVAFDPQSSKRFATVGDDQALRVWSTTQ